MRRRLQRVILCGNCRGGTSATAYTLNRHPQVVATNELAIFEPPPSLIFPRKIVWHRENMVLGDVFGGLGVKMNEEQIHQFGDKAAGWDAVERRLQFMDDEAPEGVTVYADKYPEYARRLHVVCDWVDKIVFIVRDPRDVIRSQVAAYARDESVRPHWASPTIEDTFTSPHAWIHYVQEFKRFIEKKPMPHLVLRYQDAREQAGELADFLGIDREECVCLFRKRFKPQSTWRREMPEVTHYLPAEYVKLAKEFGVWLD